MEYNLKVIHYANNKSQLRFYSVPVHISDKISNYTSNYIKDNKRDIEQDEDLEEINLHSIYNSRNRTIQQIYALARANIWDYFSTFTFDPQKVNSKNYDSCMHEISLFLKGIKKKHKDFKYLIVPELHSDGKKWHIHGLLANISDAYFKDSGKFDDSGRPIYNMITYRLGWNYHSKVQENDRIVRYITKYITKELVTETPNRHRYICSMNLDKPIIENIKINNMTDLLDRIGDSITWAKTTEYLDARITYIECDDLKEDFYLFKKVN